MRITFLGTRGGIKIRSKEHYKHSVLLVSYYSKKLIIDCGQDWINNIYNINPDAIFLTHGHIDHAAGLKNGSPCPVYATSDTWSIIKNYPIKHKIILKPKTIIKIGAIFIEAFPVEHSIIAPAVGYKITTKNKSIFYVPDLIKIIDQKSALNNILLYIGDGATVTSKHLMRKKDSTIIGHAPIEEQLKWCKQENINWVIITHCGSQITKSNKLKIEEKINKLAEKFKLKIQIAYDNMSINL